MQNFVLEEIKLVSSKEQKANSFEFETGLNIITGPNGVGKSCLIKSLYWAFGANPTSIHPDWESADVSVMVKFKVGDVTYKILRSSDFYLVFDADDRLIGRAQSVTKELGPLLSKIFNFDLKLPLRVSEEEIVVPPALMFAPFYVDQDDGWGHLWESFKSMGMFKDWRRPLLDHYTGILSLQLQNEQHALRKMKSVLSSEIKKKNAFRNVFKDIQSEISNVDFDVDFNDFQKEIESLSVKLTELEQVEFEYKESIRKAVSERNLYLEQIDIVGASVSDLKKGKKLAEEYANKVVECPTCGTEHTSSFSDRFYIAQDLFRCNELLVELKSDLQKVDSQLLILRDMSNKNLTEIKKINEVLSKRKKNVNLNDIIKVRGDHQLRGYLREKENGLLRKIEELDLDVKDQQKMVDNLRKDIKDRKTRVQDYYETVMSQCLPDLGVTSMTRDSFKDLYKSNVREQGSVKPRAFLAHTFSLAKLILEFYNGPVPPMVIDSPNQQDQDHINTDNIYSFITSQRPKGYQVFVGLADGEERDFGDANMVVLSKKGSLLDEKYYPEVSAEFNSLYNVGLL